MAGSELPGGSPVVALDPSMMVPALALVGALLVGAVVVAFVRRWQMHNKSLGPSASDQLAQFRRLYEQGAISEEEFKRLRTVLGGEIRKAIDLPARPADPAKAPVPAIQSQEPPRAEQGSQEPPRAEHGAGPAPEPPASPSGPDAPKPPGEGPGPPPEEIRPA